MHTSLIGRNEELELVLRRLEGGHGVLLAGVAGVGKTRLAREALGRLEASGKDVRRAFATAAAAGVPLGPLASVLPETKGADRLDLLRRATRAFVEAGCVLFVDDAHLLDDLSAALVHQAASGGVPVLLTVRSGEKVPDPITALWKDRVAERLELQALSEADSERLVAEELGGQPSGQTAAAVYAVSRGNPLFVKEVTAESLRRGIVREEGGIWRLSGPPPAPAHLTDLVAGHVDALDDAARSALQTAALAGELGLGTLEDLCGASAVATLDREGIIEVVADGNRRLVRPAHPLFGEVGRERLPALAAAEIKRALAAELVRHGRRRKGDAIRAAEWMLDADGTVPMDLLLFAVTEARNRFDWPLVTRLSRAAMRAGAGAEAAFGLGQALGEAGFHDEAEEILGRIDLESFDREMFRAFAASIRAYNLGIRLRRFEDARRVLDDARVHAGEFAPYLDARQAINDLFAGRLDEAEARVARVALEPGGGRLASLYPLAMTLTIKGRCSEALDLIANAPSDPQFVASESVNNVPRIIALTALGRFSEALSVAHDGYRRSLDGWGTDSVAGYAQLLGRIELMRGHVLTAARWLRESAALFREMRYSHELRWSLGGLAAAAAMSGDAAGASEAVAELDGIDVREILLMEPDMIPLGRAWTCAAQGRLADARVEIERALPAARETRQAIFEIVLLHHHRRLGGEGDPARMDELASSIGGGLFPLWVASPGARGQLEAAERLEEIGSHLDAAETALRAASLAREEGLRRVAEAAARLASAAIALCEGSRTPGLESYAEPMPLTRREREIATLAASGWSSPKIADHLVLSVRTVENHLQRVYEKLGVRGRDELRAALGR